VFRRRRKEAETADESEAEARVGDGGETDAGPAEDGVSDVSAENGVAGGAGGATAAATVRGPDGPFDEADEPDDDIPRVDLGALRVPIVDGVELRLEVNEQGELGQVLLLDGASMMQIGAFAAPRSSGIWDEVRAEIIESVDAAGGSAEEVEGLYGTELAAEVPTGTPGQLAPARFLGVDRPRWFVRALLSGPAAVDAAEAERLLSVLAGMVVVRGKDAMPIRDALPLALPKEALDAAQAQAAEQGQDGLDQLGPGPTITETR
jgi:hypothetical protein